MQSLALTLWCLLFIALGHAYWVDTGILTEIDTQAHNDWEEQLRMHRERVRASEEDIGGSPPEMMRCKYDAQCGIGDCWRGFCEEDGVCQAYWTCT